MPVKKNKLQVAPFDDIHIIGINSTLTDYKLAYFLNEKQNFNLVRLADILLDETLPYAFFYFNAGENRNAYNLVSLRHKDHLCIKLNPHIDYLLIIRNHITPERIAQLVKNMREIKEVTYAYTMDLSHNPSIEVLLERIEMHERQCLEERQ